MVDHAVERQRQSDLCELEANLSEFQNSQGYTYTNSVLENNRKSRLESSRAPHSQLMAFMSST